MFTKIVDKYTKIVVKDTKIVVIYTNLVDMKTNFKLQKFYVFSVNLNFLLFTKSQFQSSIKIHQLY